MGQTKQGIAVASLFAVTAAAFVAVVLWRYAIFRNEVDLGIFTQVIASTGHGFSSTAEGGANHLLVHWSPLIVVAWPFLQMFGPVGLEMLQAVLIAATLLPIWGLARARFATFPALGVTAVAAIYPLLCANAVGDFHEMAFVPVLTATLVYAIDRRYWTLGMACVLLLACTKEDQFVALAFNGAVVAMLARSDLAARRFGLLAAGIAIGGALLYFGAIRPLLGPHLPYHPLHFYDWTVSALSSTPVTSLLVPRLTLALLVLAPLAFLPCISRYGLFLIPGFVEIFASHEPLVLLPGEHYVPLLTGYALAAFVDGAALAVSFKRWAGIASVCVAAVTAAVIAIWDSPMEYWYYLYRTPSAHDALLQRTFAALPPNADVGAEDEIFSHLGLNARASIDMNGQEWFVYDRTHFSVRWHDVDEPAVRKLVAEGAYTVVSDTDGIVVLHSLNRGGEFLQIGEV